MIPPPAPPRVGDNVAAPAEGKKAEPEAFIKEEEDEDGEEDT